MASSNRFQITAEDFEKLPPAARNGERQALGRLLEHFRPCLQRVCQRELGRRLRSKADPSDLVQQSFMEAQVGFATFRGSRPAELQAWLLQILRRNLYDFVDRYREAKVRLIDREVPLQIQLMFDTGSLVAKGALPSDSAQANEENQLFEQGMRRLPEHYRRVILMRQCDDMPFGDIGVAMGLSQNGARKLFLRAISRLQLELRAQRDKSPTSPEVRKPR